MTVDTEARKRGEQTRLDTLVVHALNYEQYPQQDCSAWGVQPQGLNLKELTGV